MYFLNFNHQHNNIEFEFETSQLLIIIFSVSSYFFKFKHKNITQIKSIFQTKTQDTIHAGYLSIYVLYICTVSIYCMVLYFILCYTTH